MNTLTVACVQARSRNGRTNENLAGAESLVAKAVNRGAELLLCPEFLAAGYIFHDSIWESGEPRNGPTETWLRRMARRHSVFIGASYLEVEGEDFFNTFTLFSPDGEPAGRVRKASLPGFEGWYFKPDYGPKVITCDLGRIAVGICNDNVTATFWNRLRDERPDLLLMPHSAPAIDGPIIGPVASRVVCQNVASIGPLYARGFGVPVILVNKAAAGPAPAPLPLLPGLKFQFNFRGGSVICDSGGSVLARLDDQPDVAVADIQLDPAKKRSPDPANGYWARPPGGFPRLYGALWQALEYVGRGAYTLRAARRRAAERLKK